MTIIDKRSEKTTSSSNSKQKFIERNKDAIRRKLEDNLESKSIKDSKDKVKVKIKTTDEVKLEKDRSKKPSDIILPGNKEFNKGDKLQKPPPQGGGSGGSGSGDGESEEVEIELNREEYMDILFSDMELPNFIKDSLEKSKETKVKRAGYTKDGIPARLDLKKSFMEAAMRKICSENENPPFLDDIDLRYKRIEQVKVPIRHATVFFILDISASMTGDLRLKAKKFFFLYYMFLKRNYDDVDVIFIAHSDTAFEVTEEEFFYGRYSGGTKMSSPLELTLEKISKIDYNTNIYVAQSTDGENFISDDLEYFDKLHILLEKIQFYCYIEVISPELYAYRNSSTIYGRYKSMFEQEKIGASILMRDKDAVKVLNKLFKKK